VAARLQDLTKSYSCEVLISEEVYEQAGFGPDDLPQHDIEVRGRITSEASPQTDKWYRIPRT
jgi:adenylate cyclase